jgi:hypothetical protein
MSKKRASRGPFSVPRISHQIERAKRQRREITDEPLRTEPPTRDDIVPEVKSARRKRALARLLERGRIEKSEAPLSELVQKKIFPKLVHTELDCLDEAELRTRFPRNGIFHEFFQSSDFRFAFLIPSDQPNTVVAQVLSDTKFRLPRQ